MTIDFEDSGGRNALAWTLRVHVQGASPGEGAEALLWLNTCVGPLLVNIGVKLRKHIRPYVNAVTFMELGGVEFTFQSAASSKLSVLPFIDRPSCHAVHGHLQ